MNDIEYLLTDILNELRLMDSPDIEAVKTDIFELKEKLEHQEKLLMAIMEKLNA